MEVRKLEQYERYDDAALACMVVEGDNRAFDTLFRRHNEAISALLFKRVGNNPDMVDDLMQEAFMKAYINIGRYNPAYNFGAWICTIAKNTFIDFDRSRRTSAINPNNLPLDGKSGSPQALAPSPEESIINAQRRAQIEQYIKLLPDDYRRLFTLRFIDEYSYEEIAEVLEMKLGTVKTRIFRVRAMMCRLITEGDAANFQI